MQVPVLTVLFRREAPLQQRNISCILACEGCTVTFDLASSGVKDRTLLREGLTAAPYLNSELPIAV